MKKASDYYKDYLKQNTAVVKQAINEDVVLQSIVKQVEDKILEVISEGQPLKDIQAPIALESVTGLNSEDLLKRGKVIVRYMTLLGFTNIKFELEKITFTI